MSREKDNNFKLRVDYEKKLTQAYKKVEEQKNDMFIQNYERDLFYTQI